MRSEPTPLCLEIDGIGAVQLLRPVEKGDALFALYSAENMTNVIKCCRGFGFAQSNRAHDDIPKGVWYIKEHFCVTYKKQDGAKGFKKCKTLADAESFLDTLQQESDSAEYGSHDDQGDDDDREGHDREADA